MIFVATLLLKREEYSASCREDAAAVTYIPFNALVLSTRGEF